MSTDVALDRAKFPCGAITRGHQFSTFRVGGKFFKPRKGLNRQIERPIKTMDRANGPDGYVNDVLHGSFLSMESPQMRSNQHRNWRNPFRAETIRDELKSTVRKLAEPIEAGESVKAQQNKVARKTGIKPRRVEKLWYGLIPNPLATDLERVRAAYSQWLADREAQLTHDLERLRKDLDAIR